MTDSATTLFNSATSSSVATSISDFAKSIGTKFEDVGQIKLPLPNVLHDYASYDYIIGFSVITNDDLAAPDTTYMVNKSVLKNKETGATKQSDLRLICKGANSDPENRIKTAYGKFDFYIDDLVIESVIGLERSNNTNTTNITFTVTEPYSMGLFSIACQQAAWEAGHKNWREAPFLLTIDFRGNDEIGMMQMVPTASRYILVKFQEMSMTVNHTGSVYQCSVFAWNNAALTSKHADLKVDMSVKGSTVQEVLQTGENSLQAVWNKRLQQLKEDKIVEVPDEIIILFPDQVYSEEDAEAGANTEQDAGATSGSASPQDDIYKVLGVTKSEKTNNQVQDPAKCNIIGQATLGVGIDKKADAPFGKDNVVYDEKLKVNVRAQNTPVPTENDFRFRQDTSIPNAINQVIIQSSFPQTALDPAAMTEEGYVKWWRIDTQMYNVSTDANYKSTGTQPKILVYRVIPYNVHNSSGLVGSNAKPKGYDVLYQNIVKEYHYIYTGKNVDVLNFEIKLENSFAVSMAADAGKHSQDVKHAAQQGEADHEADIIVPEGEEPEEGTMGTSVDYNGTKSNTDKLGGAGSDTPVIRAARLFHESVTRGTDMIMLDMKIVGDPFFIAQSGMGNYTSKPTQHANLNKDGSVNWQNGEVHVGVIFRTPIELNQYSGLYQFEGEKQAGDKLTTPVMQYSGLFRINQVTSTFKTGQFEQRLFGQRLPLQEKEKESEVGPFSTSKLGQSAEKLLKKAGGAISDGLDTLGNVASDAYDSVATFVTGGE
jgi:hypothetical protein